MPTTTSVSIRITILNSTRHVLFQFQIGDVDTFQFLYSVPKCWHNCYNVIGPCLFESGLIPKRLTYREDAQLLNYGIGITNIVPRTTRAANELSRWVPTPTPPTNATALLGLRKEMKEWSQVMIERMKELKPLVACFNGKGIYEIFNGGKCEVGIQPLPLPGTETVSRV